MDKWDFLCGLGFVMLPLAMVVFFAISFERDYGEKKISLTKQTSASIAALWRRAGVIPVFGPVEAVYIDELLPSQNSGKAGILSITPKEIVFHHQDGGRVVFPLDCVRFASADQDMLILYMERPELGWYIYRWHLSEALSAADTLYSLAQIPQIPYIYQAPVPAQQLTQDVYGAWEMGPAVSLCLFWNHLLRERHEVFPCASIRALIHYGDILRIELKPDEQWQAVCFEIAYDEEWANSLTQLTGLTVDEEIGRKKKESEMIL
jgi:hypothetical protein